MAEAENRTLDLVVGSTSWQKVVGMEKRQKRWTRFARDEVECWVMATYCVGKGEWSVTGAGRTMGCGPWTVEELEAACGLLWPCLVVLPSDPLQIMSPASHISRASSRDVQLTNRIQYRWRMGAFVDFSLHTSLKVRIGNNMSVYRYVV